MPVLSQPHEIPPRPVSSFCVFASSVVGGRGPNIIIFLADAPGYADISVNGCKDIPMPHIDSIARNGVRFTDGCAIKLETTEGKRKATSPAARLGQRGRQETL